MLDFSYTQNREVSWLRFNERVLAEAEDKGVPLLERLRFASIFDHNLDEFIMIRVGSLYDRVLLKKNDPDDKSDLSPKEQLRVVYEQLLPLYKKRDKTYRKLWNDLRSINAELCGPLALNKREKREVDEYYQTMMEPLLSPQIIDATHPFPHLESLQDYVYVQLKQGSSIVFGVLSIPKSLPPYFRLNSLGFRIVLISAILMMHVKTIFKGYEVVDATLIRVTRNGDISISEDAFDEEDNFDMREEMKQLLKKRDRLNPVRLEVERGISKESQKSLCKVLRLQDHQIFVTKQLLAPSFIEKFIEALVHSGQGSEVYKPYLPVYPSIPRTNIMRVMASRDVLFSYPYESFNGFLDLVQEAVDDKRVVSIRISIYRVASHAKLIDLLCRGAQNGKEIQVVMELRARFDEENNIRVAELLEANGCQVSYGLEKMKVHSKLMLITYIDRQRTRWISHVGTGNFNEQTARLYTDFSYFTANAEVAQDLITIFRDLGLAHFYPQPKKLLIAPVNFKEVIIAKIAEQTELGERGLIRLKCNSLTDRGIIDALSSASQAGVRIEMVVRGICCLLPGVAGKTETIVVHSIVGRFLEHSRIYIFGETRPDIYLSSADLMTRNTQKRVEVAIPVLDDRIKQELSAYFLLCMKDNVKGRSMDEFGRYHHIKKSGEAIDSQQVCMEKANREQDGKRYSWQRAKAALNQLFLKKKE